MTTDSRFLALVAKVDEVEHHAKYELASSPRVSLKDLDKLLAPYRALKGEIMRHEPIERYKGQLFVCGYCRDEDGCFEIDFPCKPWLDMEAEVGR